MAERNVVKEVMTMASKNTCSLSPSAHHRYLMDHTEQTLRYDGGDVGRWQRKLRRRLRQLLRLRPRKHLPLNVRSLWKREHPLGSIERIVFTSEPYVDVPGYVCLPKSAGPPYTFFICLQGHQTGMHESIAVDREDEITLLEVEGDRDFALGCMARGIAALCVEQRAFGERRELLQQNRAGNDCYDPMMQLALLGRTLPGERIYDVDRAIDYLASRGDVDMKRLGLMGLSGGGMITICAAALLPRVRLAMPAGHFCTYRDGLMSIHHCGCCYIPGIYNYAEMADVAGLIAPRPIVVVTGREDRSKPIKGVRKAFRDLKRAYRAAGAEKHCHLVVGEGGHRFYAEKAWPKMLAELGRIR